MSDTNEMLFYKSKNMLVIIGIGVFILSMFFLMCSYVIFKDKSYFISGFCVVGGLFFLFLFFRILKKVIHPKPIVKLTDQYFILYLSANNPVPIQWKDIRDCLFSNVNGTQIMELMLKDEEKYRSFVSSKLKKIFFMDRLMGFSQFNLYWRQLKKSDRFLEELHKRIPHITSLNASNGKHHYKK